MRKRKEKAGAIDREQVEGYLWLMRCFTEELYKELRGAVSDLETPSFHPRPPKSAKLH